MGNTALVSALRNSKICAGAVYGVLYVKTASADDELFKGRFSNDSYNGRVLHTAAAAKKHVHDGDIGTDRRRDAVLWRGKGSAPSYACRHSRAHNGACGIEGGLQKSKGHHVLEPLGLAGRRRVSAPAIAYGVGLRRHIRKGTQLQPAEAALPPI